MVLKSGSERDGSALAPAPLADAESSEAGDTGLPPL
jgi:hypothetical protein